MCQRRHLSCLKGLGVMVRTANADKDFSYGITGSHSGWGARHLSRPQPVERTSFSGKCENDGDSLNIIKIH